jgi:hypothetical protein
LGTTNLESKYLKKSFDLSFFPLAASINLHKTHHFKASVPFYTRNKIMHSWENKNRISLCNPLPKFFFQKRSVARSLLFVCDSKSKSGGRGRGGAGERRHCSGTDREEGRKKRNNYREIDGEFVCS